MSPRLLTLLSTVLLGAISACSRASSDEAIVRHAAARLGTKGSELRVSSQTDLAGQTHRFHLVTQQGKPALVVVEAPGGQLFDSRTPDAFDRVARAEKAYANLGQLGAERVALWYGVLGGGTCPSPSSTDAHFASVERQADTLTIRYPAGADAGMLRTCMVTLAPDGSLRQGRLVTTPTPQATARTWRGGDVN